MSLIATNIPSFASGLDLWGTSRNIGVLAVGEGSIPQTLIEHEQKLGDGILEFVSFKGPLALGIERVSCV